ncbi:MAG TPA: MFS transporter [Janibacter terrae]|nr:MFS transporter [Janibacter terrae]
MSSTTARRGLTVGLLTCVTAVAFEGMAVVTAMPAAAADLGDLELYAWAFTAVMIAQLIAIVVAGRTTDVIGPVRPLLVGLVVFALGVVVAALAPTMAVLLAGRFVQGLGGGAVNLALMVVTAIAYDPVERARLMTWYSACWILPSLVGPAVAAWLSETFSWHWVFWAVLPLVLVGVVLMAPGLARLASRGRRHAEDAAAPVPTHAAVAVALGVAALQVAGQNLGPASLVWLGVGVALCGVWFRRLMPVGFSPAASGLPAVVTTRLLVSGTFFGAQSFLPLMLTGRGVPLAVAGLVITVGSMGWVGGSWLQARPWFRLSRNRIIVAGAACVAGGVALLAGSGWLGGTDLVLPTLASVLAGVGMGLQSSSTSLATMQLSAEAELGRNTGSLQVGETAGNALLAGAAGTIFAALSPVAPDVVTFGWLMTALVVTAVGGVLAAGRIGHVENHLLAVADS